MKCRCRKPLLGLLLAMSALPAVACYAVYDSGGRIVYRGDKPPVDMSLPLHETLPARFPAGSHMIFDASSTCPAVIGSLEVGDGGPDNRTQSPLLTNESTARAKRMPHRTVGRDIAVVPQDAAAMEPGISVVPTPPARPSRTR